MKKKCDIAVNWLPCIKAKLTVSLIDDPLDIEPPSLWLASSKDWIVKADIG